MPGTRSGTSSVPPRRLWLARMLPGPRGATIEQNRSPARFSQHPPGAALVISVVLALSSARAADVPVYVEDSARARELLMRARESARDNAGESA